MQKIILVLYLCSIPIIGFAEDTIRLASGEWEPYISENLLYYGVASRIVTEAFALQGVKVTYGFYPWKRSYSYAEQGQWDGTLVWFDTPERRKIFYLSDPVIDVQYVFFHLKSYAFTWNTIDELKKIKIGATLGYHYGETFERAEKAGTITVQRVPKDEQNFQKLLRGRIHIFPNELDVGYAMIQRNFAPEQAKLFAHHAKPLRAEPLRLLLSKKIKRNQQMITLFNKGLKQLRDKGKIEQYIAESQRGEYKK